MSAVGRRFRYRLVQRIHRSRLGRLLQDVVRQPYVYGPHERVHVGRNVMLLDATLNTMSGEIRIGDGSFCGHHVSLLTGTHDLSALDPRRAVPSSGRDIVIGRNVWLASNATVLGPCRIGDGAVVAAGAVVTHDVPADAIVAGVPARPVGQVPACQR